MLDGLGLDLVWFTEHHFLDDGYLPSWVPMRARLPLVPNACGYRATSACCRSTIRCGWPRTWRYSTISAMAGSRSASAWATRRTSPRLRSARLAPRLADGRGIEVLRHRSTGESSVSWQALRSRRCRDQAALREPGGPPLWIAAMSEAGAQRAHAMTAISCRRARGRWCSIRGARR